MDIMMPNLNGYDAVKAIKEIKNIPTIMISAKGEEYDKLKGFELGIDDYIVKPFSPKEVMARIKALMKRTKGLNDCMELDSLKIDFDGHIVFVKNEQINLTKKEYELLLTLIKNKGIVLSRDKLLSEIWGYDFDGDYRTIDTHIKMLRADLKECGNMIKTVRGVGYKFENDTKEN
jgi:two-component system, OmpR family, response regulator ResD